MNDGTRENAYDTMLQVKSATVTWTHARCGYGFSIRSEKTPRSGHSSNPGLKTPVRRKAAAASAARSAELNSGASYRIDCGRDSGDRPDATRWTARPVPQRPKLAATTANTSDRSGGRAK